MRDGVRLGQTLLRSLSPCVGKRDWGKNRALVNSIKP